VVFGRRGSRPFNAADFDMFLRREGRLFRVEDVAVKDGALQSASGKSVAPTAQFAAEAPAPETPAEAGRLVRRPPD
jgi:hypothetical protein